MTLLRPTRRGFVFGAIAAPAIVRAANIMPVFAPRGGAFYRFDGLSVTRHFGQSVVLPEAELGLEIIIMNGGDAPVRVFGTSAGKMISPNCQKTYISYLNFGPLPATTWELANEASGYSRPA